MIAVLALCALSQGLEIGPDHVVWTRTDPYGARRIELAAGGSEVWIYWEEGSFARLSARAQDGTLLQHHAPQPGRVDVAAGASRALAAFDTGSVVRVRAYSSASSTPLWTYDFPGSAPQEDVAITDDGALGLAGWSSAGRVVKLDGATGAELDSVDGVGWDLSLAADGSRVAVADYVASTITVLDVATLTPEYVVGAGIYGFELSKNGRALLIDDGGVLKVHLRDPQGDWAPTPVDQIVGMNGGLGALSGDGAVLFLASEGIGTVRFAVVDTRTGTVRVQRNEAGVIDLYAVAANADGTRFASLQEGSSPVDVHPQALIFDEQLNTIADLDRPDLALAVDFSADATLVAVAGMNFGFGGTSGAAHLLDLAQPPMSYCQPKVSSKLCAATLSSQAPGDLPISGAGDYSIVAGGVQTNTVGVFLQGSAGPAQTPYFGGTLCVAPPLSRVGPITSTGPGDCGGALGFIVNSGVAPFDPGPGGKVWLQYWFRDSANGAGLFGTALSDALELTYL